MSEPLDPIEDLAAAAPVEGGGEADAAPAEPTPEEIEARAIEMGWKPQSAFKGDQSKFVSAAEYVKRGEEIMPFLRKDLAAAYKKIEALEGAVQRSVEHISRAEKQAYDRARRDLESQLEQQALMGDAAGVKATTEEIVALDREVIAKPEKTEAATDPDFDAWRQQNTWFGKDEALTAAVVAIANAAQKEGYPNGPLLVKEVDRRVREKFPHLYTNPNRTGAAAVEGLGAAARPRGKTYSDLPPEARAMCDDFVKTIKGFSKEKYVKDYFAQGAAQ